MSKHVINPYDVVLANQGFMKIDNIEIAELKDLEIKIVPEMKEIALLNSVSKGKFPTNFNGTITFEINKTYSRFKPTILECAKYLQLFTFSLEATVFSGKKKNNQYKAEETIYIGNCWIEGDITLFALKSDNDFLTEKFSAGFQIESADFTDVIDDNQDDWESLSHIKIGGNE